MPYPFKDGPGMELRSLKIEMQTYGEKKGQYNGTIEFAGETGIVQISLSPERCVQLFAVVADGVIDTARMVAGELTRECIAQQARPVVIGNVS